MVPEHLADPIRWKKPRRIFVNSMSDLFHEKLTNEEIAAVFGVMAAAPQHTFQILTKRAKRMREWFEWAGTLNLDHIRAFAQRALDPTFTKRYVDRGTTWPLPNVHLGVSVENQEAANERIPQLLKCPAVVHFLSCEPLIGEVDLDPPLCDDFDRHGDAGYGLCDDGATPWCSECEAERSYGHWLHLDGGIDWVVAGCESGPGARECEVGWLRQIRDTCVDTGTAFFLKQAKPIDGACMLTDIRPIPQIIGRIGEIIPVIGVGANSNEKGGGVVELPYLDGIQWTQFPEVLP